MEPELELKPGEKPLGTAHRLMTLASGGRSSVNLAVLGKTTADLGFFILCGTCWCTWA